MLSKESRHKRSGQTGQWGIQDMWESGVLDESCSCGDEQRLSCFRHRVMTLQFMCWLKSR